MRVEARYITGLLGLLTAATVMHAQQPRQLSSDSSISPRVQSSTGVLDQVRELIAQYYVDVFSSDTLDAMIARGLAHERQMLTPAQRAAFTPESLDVAAARGLVYELHDPFSTLRTVPLNSSSIHGTPIGAGSFLVSQLGLLLWDSAGSGAIVRGLVRGTQAASGVVHKQDKIVRVGRTDVRGWPSRKVGTLLSGTAGTPVIVTFERDTTLGLGTSASGTSTVQAPVRPDTGMQCGEQSYCQTLTETFVRTNRPVSSPVPYTLMLQDSTAYIPLRSFGMRGTSSTLLDTIIHVTQHGARRLILDLRSNPGGILEEAVAVSNLFLAQGQLVVQTHSRDVNIPHIAESIPTFPTLPLVVLVDGWTESSAEIVASALQDHDRAVLLGMPTFGKGIGQVNFTISGPTSYVLHLTSVRLRTPSGRSIEQSRTVLSNGQIVPVMPLKQYTDVAADVAQRHLPKFETDGHRTVYGQRGIFPDVWVPADQDTLAGTQAMAEILNAQENASVVLQQLTLYAYDLQNSVGPEFVVTPAIREEFVRRLRVHHIGLDDTLLAKPGAEAVITDLIGKGVASLLFGPVIAKQRFVDQDRQLQQALALLQRATDQTSVFAAAQKFGQTTIPVQSPRQP